MKASRAILSALCVGLVLGSAAHAASYTESLAAADAAVAGGRVDAAIQSLDAAIGIAANPGEKALALAKKGDVLAFVKTDYAGARLAVDEALKVVELAPVAKIIALRALAECQIKGGRDFAGAMPNLEAAVALPGEDWAKPGVTLMLADCMRETSQLGRALELYQQVVTMPMVTPDQKAHAFLHQGFIFQYDRKDSAKAREAYANAVMNRPSLKGEVDGRISALAP